MRNIEKLIVAALALTVFVNCSANQQSSNPTLSTLTTGSPASSTHLPNPLRGTVDSGGGRAIVCHDPQGGRVVRDLDLYESKKTSTLTPAPPQGALSDEWNYFAHRFADRFGDAGLRASTLTRLLQLKDQFLKQATFVSEKDALLRPIDDSKEVITVPGCKVVQLANWQDDDSILVQKELWDALSPRDQAGLIAHEFVYSAYRVLGHRDSVYPRRLVGLLFSSLPLGKMDVPISDYTCMRALDPENVFDVTERIDLNLPAKGTAGQLILQSYPSQILLQALNLEIAPSEISNALEACRGNDSQDIQLEDPLKLMARTRYFKDQLDVNFQVACGSKRQASGSAGPELKITLKSHRVGKESVYTCIASQTASAPKP